jgi:hypothetical protein
MNQYLTMISVNVVNAIAPSSRAVLRFRLTGIYAGFYFNTGGFSNEW